MDLLTHLFLPIAVIYALRPALFPSPRYLSLAVFAVVPDLDKLLGLQGAFHSLITLGTFGAVLFLLERWYRDETTYSTVIVVLLFSHLLLDFLDGGPVLFLYPLVDIGIGLQYPTQIVFGDSLGSSGIRNPIPEIRVAMTDRTRTTYPLITGYGVLSALSFAIIYFGKQFSTSLRRNYR